MIEANPGHLATTGARPKQLSTISPLSESECIALIGGGGKTTTMFSLANELTQRGKSVVVTTTTKIWPPADIEVSYILGRSACHVVRQTLRSSRPVVVGSRQGDDGKVIGLEADDVCELVAEAAVDVVLCEADGAAGRPVKVHGNGEPVIPACADVVLILAGPDAIGVPADQGSVHRLEALGIRTTVAPGTRIGTHEMVQFLQAAARTTPSDALIVYLINKADDVRRVNAGRRIAEALASVEIGRTVLLTSRGSVVEGWPRMEGGPA